MNFIQAFPENITTDVERYVYLDKAEKEAAALKKEIAKGVVRTVTSNGGFLKTEFGGAQSIERVTKKAKDSLKEYLLEKGVLDICMKDEVDLSKVKELEEAGMLDEELTNHITVNTTEYIKIK